MEREPRMVYDRVGVLSQTTRLNEEKASGFMQRADMRRDIVVVDSDQKPESNTVSVASDILAFRAIEPIRRLTEVRFRPKPFHTLVRQSDRFEVRVHEQVIDDKIRSGSYLDRTDYEEQFLKLLNKAVKSGVAESLWREKLGWHDQSPNISNYLIYLSALPIYVSTPGIGGEFIWVGILFLGLNPTLHWLRKYEISRRQTLGLSLPPYLSDRSWKWAWLPTLPIEKWISGRLYLARHGNSLIIPIVDTSR